MNKVTRYTVKLGTQFDANSTPAVYINWYLQSEWQNPQVVTVTPGSEVTLLDFILDVPTGASKLIKFTTSDKALGFFVDSNGELLEKNMAYLVSPRENWVELEVPSINVGGGGGPK